MIACASSGRSPIGRNLRSGTTVAIPQMPRKALAHAAITVLRPDDPNAQPLGTRLRWAVFLPLDDGPEPRSSEIVESTGTSPAWEIILHGYFWPSQDRRSIPGVTDPGDGANDTGMRYRWNRAVCENLLLPLLPSALAKAVNKVEERVARELLDAVVKSKIVRDRSDAVKHRHWLLPLVAADGVRWEVRYAKECRVMSIPRWRQAPELIRRQFVASCDECSDAVVFIDDDAPRLAGEFDDWTVDHLERLLNCIPGDAFGSPQSVRWIEGFVRHVFGQDACGDDIRSAELLGGLWDISVTGRLPTRLDVLPRAPGTSCGKHGETCAGRCRRCGRWKRRWTANRR